MTHQNVYQLSSRRPTVTIIHVRQVPRAEMLEIAASAFDGRDTEVFRTIKHIDWLPMWWLRRMSTDGTVYEPIVLALKAEGLPTASKLGAIMDYLCGDRAKMHELFCKCVVPTVSGHVMACRLRREAAKY